VKIGLSIPISGVGVLNQVDPDMVLGITSDTDGTFTLPLQNATTTITVDWGDASSDVITTYNQAELTHTYASTSTNYDITISGQFGGIRFAGGGDRVRLRNIQNWGSTVWSSMDSAFYNCTNMTITATDKPNCSQVVTFYRAFGLCSSLTSIDLNGVISSNCTTFSEVFQSCTLLSSVDILGGDTSGVITFAKLFNNCPALVSIDVTGIVTSTTTTINNMFALCSTLTTITKTGWDTSNVTTLSKFVSGCSALVSLDLSALDLAKVTTWEEMCSSCVNMTSFTPPASCASVTTFYRAFFICSKLVSVDLSGKITANCTTLSGMFQSSPLITTIDLSGGVYSGITTFNNMCINCSALSTINVTNLVTATATNIGGMFSGCTSLTTAEIDTWDIQGITNATNFMASVTLTTAKYDAMLIEMDSQNPVDSVSWNFGSSTYTGGTVDSGTTDSTTASKLVDSTQNFITTVTIGDIVKNTTDNTYAAVTAIDSDTTLSLDTDIMISGETYQIDGNAAAKAKYGLTNTDLLTITDGGAAAWTPASLGADLALWLDADDAGTITLNGSDVAQWDDKSGNGNDVSNGAASTQPAYLATGWNGNPTVSFTATGQEFLFKAGVSNFASNDDFTLASAFEFLQTTNAWDMATGWRSVPNTSTSPNGGTPILQCMGGTDTQIGVHHTDVADTRIKVDVTSRLGKKIATVGRSGGTDGNGGAVTVTSTGFSQPTYQTDATQTWTSAAATGFQIGGKQQVGTAYGDKYVSEVVGFNTKLSTENRQKLEGYLAWKWGLEANLPTLHPYKNSPPTA
jgi:surface protein